MNAIRPAEQPLAAMLCEIAGIPSGPKRQYLYNTILAYAEGYGLGRSFGYAEGYDEGRKAERKAE